MPRPSMATSWSSLPPYQVQACLPHSSLHIPGVLLPYAHCLHQAHAVSAGVSMQMTAVLMMWKSCSPISGWICASGTSHCWCACTLHMKGDIARSCSALLAPSLMSFCLCRLCRCLALSNAPQLRSASTRGLTSSRYAGVWQPARAGKVSACGWISPARLAALCPCCFANLRLSVPAGGGRPVARGRRTLQ